MSHFEKYYHVRHLERDHHAFAYVSNGEKTQRKRLSKLGSSNFFLTDEPQVLFCRVLITITTGRRSRSPSSSIGLRLPCLRRSEHFPHYTVHNEGTAGNITVLPRSIQRYCYTGLFIFSLSLPPYLLTRAALSHLVSGQTAGQSAVQASRAVQTPDQGKLVPGRTF